MRSVLHKAGWVMARPDVWIENGVVEVNQNRIVEVSQARKGLGAVDHGSGVILPALVNAHTHLSLSALIGRTNTSNGFMDWVKDLIHLRDVLSDEEISNSANWAAKEAKDAGTGLIAEVGPHEPGASAIIAANLHGIVFSEILGNCRYLPHLPRDGNDVCFSYAGHGLHSTAPEVMQALKISAESRNSLFSLHLAESEAEHEFLTGHQADWADLLTSRGIDFAHWDIRCERPVSRAKRLGLLDKGTLAVHVLQVNRDEMAVLKETDTSVCLCPRSNFALHGQLPDIKGLIDAGLAPALGTDSLASTPSLSLFDEMSFIAEKYPEIDPQTILGLATINGAKSLGRIDIGSLEPGNKAQLIYVELAADSADEAALQLVTDKPARLEWL